MADYIIEKAEPAESNQYIVKYLKEAEDSVGETVDVVDRRDTLTQVGLQEQIDAKDTQIASIGAEKAKLVKMLTEMKEL